MLLALICLLVGLALSHVRVPASATSRFAGSPTERRYQRPAAVDAAPVEYG